MMERYHVRNAMNLAAGNTAELPLSDKFGVASALSDELLKGAFRPKELDTEESERPRIRSLLIKALSTIEHSDAYKKKVDDARHIVANGLMLHADEEFAPAQMMANWGQLKVRQKIATAQVMTDVICAAFEHAQLPLPPGFKPKIKSGGMRETDYVWDVTTNECKAMHNTTSVDGYYNSVTRQTHYTNNIYVDVYNGPFTRTIGALFADIYKESREYIASTRHPGKGFNDGDALHYDAELIRHDAKYWSAPQKLHSLHRYYTGHAIINGQRKALEEQLESALEKERDNIPPLPERPKSWTQRLGFGS